MRHAFLPAGKNSNMESLNTTLPQLKSMTEVTEKLQHDGFINNFRATEEGMLESLETRELFRPEQVRILNFFRFEGMSDPNDNSILFAIETDNGLRGTLVDGYGASSDSNLDDFIKAVENIAKKNSTATADSETSG
jgi:hypothetical protein